MKKTLLTITAITLLIGCGGSRMGSTDIKTPEEKAELKQIGQDFKKAWKKLEDEGKIIKLDRSKKLLGTDTNNDGIRDDIEKVIDKLAREEDLKPKEVRAVEQSAKALQEVLRIDLNNEKELLRIVNEVNKGVECIYSMDESSIEKLDKVDDEITSKTFNTKERTLKYIKYNQMLSGRVFGEYEGNPCE